MIARARLLVLLARPAVVVLLGLFAMTGLAQGGAGNDASTAVPALVVVMAFLLCAVVVNDLGDAAIDRINVPGRSLVGVRHRQELVTVAASSAVVALVVAAFVRPWAAVVVAGGLGLAVAYSARPMRLADRGAVASLLLPAGYVAVPYLVGLLAAGGSVGGQDLRLLGGLYLGFVGRILLKDFRDVQGDALFGKRTFLVRHGRRATCALSGVCWVLGLVVLLGVRDVSTALLVGDVALVVVALGLLRALAVDRGPRRDEALIAAVAVVGRGTVVTLVAHLTAADPRLTVALVALTLGQAVSWVRIARATARTSTGSSVRTSSTGQPPATGEATSSFQSSSGVLTLSK